MRARHPVHQVDDMNGLLDDHLPGDALVEKPFRLARQIAGMAVALHVENLANAARVDVLNRRYPRWMEAQLKTQLQQPA